jgi:hypothetical protein
MLCLTALICGKRDDKAVRENRFDKSFRPLTDPEVGARRLLKNSRMPTRRARALWGTLEG